MGDLQNVFSWSKSRDETFRDCQRKYFYDKYQSWGGWDSRAPKDARLAYIYKNLKNRWAWKGETVHHVIESSMKSLRMGHPMELEEALTLLTQTMRQDFRDSKAKRYFDEPKKKRGLFEHEYEKRLSDADWKELHAGSEQCLRNFYSSPAYQDFLNDDKKNWLLIEDLEEFEWESNKIFVKLDFARRKNNTIEIFDWKTGKEPSNSEAESDVQLGTYAIYAMHKWSVALENIRTFHLYVSQPHTEPKEKKLTPKLIEKTQDFIRESASMMKNLLSDPQKNTPKPREAFTFTENTRLCGTCVFYKICEKYQL